MYRKWPEIGHLYPKHYPFDMKFHILMSNLIINLELKLFLKKIIFDDFLAFLNFDI